MEKRIRKLREYQEKGYVFHGSKDSGIEVLEPREALDADRENDFNNDRAVFASRRVEASIIFAVVSRQEVPEDLRDREWGVESRDKQIVALIPKEWKQYVVESKGVVYVLDGNLFEAKGRGSWQVKARRSMEVEDVVEVVFKDFEKLGGRVIWR